MLLCNWVSVPGRPQASVQEVLRPLPQGHETPPQEVRELQFSSVHDFFQPVTCCRYHEAEATRDQRAGSV